MLKGCPELAHIWEIGKKMWDQDWPGTYKALDREWPVNQQPMFSAIRGIKVHVLLCALMKYFTLNHVY